MRKQMTKRDRLPRARCPFKILTELVVQSDPVVLNEQHDSGGDELLAHRSDLENSIGPCSNAIFQIGKPISFRLDQRAVFDHRNGNRGNVLTLHHRLDVIIDVIRANSDGGNKNQSEGKQKMTLAMHSLLQSVKNT